MKTVPVRGTPEPFDATESVTLPLPVPLAPETTLIKPLLLTADQPHPPCVVTFTLNVSPPAAAPRLAGLIE
jgi:hypothetical protein